MKIILIVKLILFQYFGLSFVMKPYQNRISHNFVYRSYEKAKDSSFLYSINIDNEIDISTSNLKIEIDNMDKIKAKFFHHVEFYCSDATNTHKRFMLGLGMQLLAKSDQSTSNSVYASYLIQSGQLRMLFTAPYLVNSEQNSPNTLSTCLPGYCPDTASIFTQKHGVAVRAIAIEVDDVKYAFDTMVSNGAKSHISPVNFKDNDDSKGYVEFAELFLYEDIILRIINTKNFKGHFLPNFKDLQPPAGAPVRDFKLQRFDHIVNNVWQLQPILDKLKFITGFHEFAEFTAVDVGTVDSGLNSVVLANSDEEILLPFNEPTYGTRRKSQIQTYLEQNRGEGVQHMALFSSDIFYTLHNMRAMTDIGGFEFMDPPAASYYQSVRLRLGNRLTEEQYKKAEEYGVLLDTDESGVLMQIFTKPIGDRVTLFLEIIQRIGCIDEVTRKQKAGCGGFGKGNFKDLFKSIEDYEKSLAID